MVTSAVARHPIPNHARLPPAPPRPSTPPLGRCTCSRRVKPGRDSRGATWGASGPSAAPSSLAGWRTSRRPPAHADAARALGALGRSLSPTGLLVLKENYPYWLPPVERSAAFAVDVPEGEHGRYDVTRPDAHHRLLFHAARLRVVQAERGSETVTWVLGAEAGAAGETVDAAAVLLGALDLRGERAAHLEARWARRVVVEEGEAGDGLGGGEPPH
eukprot:scaffold2742_cov130-Isochrysis_galbana.AAC.12